MKRKMRAVICPAYGPPDVLRLAEVEKPQPKSTEVLVKVRATTVTVADVRIRAFNVPKSFWIPARLMLGLTKPRNAILGVEFAGIVEEIGSDVKKFKKGDEVFGSTLGSMGGYAEYKTAPEGAIIAKPANINFGEAAAITIGALTALHFLRLGGITKGQKVLIYGASGSVGSYAVQLARHYGAEVTGVCSTGNVPLVQSLGAQKVIDYKARDYEKQLETYDIIMDAVDKASFSVCNKALSGNGVYLNVTQPFRSLEMMRVAMTTKKKIITGQSPPWTDEPLKTVTELVASGKVKVIVDQVYPFDQIVDAHRYVDAGHKKGNVVITVS
jgi:NADPH:quinone reductase-like Zn-dependent oxidoreductase